MGVPQQIVHLVGIQRTADDVPPIVACSSPGDNARNRFAIMLGKKRSDLVDLVDEVHRDLLVDLLHGRYVTDSRSIVVSVEQVLRNVAERTVAYVM